MAAEPVVLELMLKDQKFAAELRQSERAAKKFDRAISGAKSEISSLSNAVFSLRGLVASVGAAFAVGKFIQAANQQEDAVNAVSTALKRTGEFSEEALKDLENYASKLQDITGIGDETTLQMLSLAQSFGAGKDQAKELVTASAELAAATGKSLEEATRQVSKTLGGFAGELGEVNPAIKALTAEQLKAGKAAEILIDQYGGSAASKLNTFSGALTATTGRFGDLLEQLGFVITKNPEVTEAIQDLGDVFLDLTGYVEDNREEIQEFISQGVEALIGDIPRAERAIKAFGEAAAILADASPLGKLSSLFSDTSDEADDQTSIIEDLTLAYLQLAESIIKVYKAALIVPDVLGEALGFGDLTEATGLDKLDDAIDALQEKIANPPENNLMGEVESGADKAKEAVDRLNDSLNQSARGGGGSGSESFSKIPAGGPLDPRTQAPRPAGAPSAASTFDVPLGPQRDIAPAAAAFGKDAASEFGTALGSGDFLGALQQGIGGLSGVGGIGTGSIFGASGPAVGAFATSFAAAAAPALIGFLAQGPDVAKQQVEAFIDELPRLMENIAKAFPVVITTLAENADQIIIALVRGVPKIIRALTDAELWAEVVTVLAEELAGGVAFELEKLTPTFDEWGNKIEDGAVRFRQDLQRNFSFRALNEKLIASAQNFGELIDGGFEAAVLDFKNDFNDALKDVGQSFGDGLGTATEAIQTSGDDFRDGVLDARDQLLDGVNEAADEVKRNFSEAGREFVRPLERLVENLPGGGGGDGGFLGQVFGGAKGGLVSGSGNRDTELFRLKPGELVLDPQRTERLDRAITQLEGGGGGEVAGLLAMILEAVRAPQQVETAINIDGRKIGDTILQLNRRNARLSA